MGFIIELFLELLTFSFYAKIFSKDRPPAPGEDDPDPFAANRPEIPPNQDPPRII
jgi:hypothetical protein